MTGLLSKNNKDNLPLRNETHWHTLSNSLNAKKFIDPPYSFSFHVSAISLWKHAHDYVEHYHHRHHQWNSTPAPTFNKTRHNVTRPSIFLVATGDDLMKIFVNSHTTMTRIFFSNTTLLSFNFTKAKGMRVNRIDCCLSDYLDAKKRNNNNNNTAATELKHKCKYKQHNTAPIDVEIREKGDGWIRK